MAIFVFNGCIVREFVRKVNAENLQEARQMYEDNPRQIIEDRKMPPIEMLEDICNVDGEVLWESDEFN